MAKYIIDVPDNTQWIQWMNVSEKDGSAYFDYKAPEDLTPYVRSESYIDGLKKGQNEVWEFAKNLISMSGNEVSDMMGCMTNFGEVISNMSYQEARAKYNKWKKEKEEIYAGDEVVNHLGRIYIIYHVDRNKQSAYGIDVTRGYPLSQETFPTHGRYMPNKTGRRFPEIAELLKRIKKESYN